MMPERDWNVGIAEVRTARSPDFLAAYGLGSCVAVTLYDAKNKVGGLAHVMLPSSRLQEIAVTPGKFADTGIEALWTMLLSAGADPEALRAKLTGGANMFTALAYQAVPIGTRNVVAAREKLAQKGIPILGEEVGGAQGRTILFSLADGRVEVRKLNKPVVWI